jgi:hypothetical protein
MRRLRRGMTVLQRDELRRSVLERQLALAYRRSAEYGLSQYCRRAMVVTSSDPLRAGELHAACRAEDPGGPGCLCQHHDVRDTDVASGTAPLDTGQDDSLFLE